MGPTSFLRHFVRLSVPPNCICLVLDLPVISGPNFLESGKIALCMDFKKSGPDLKKSGPEYLQNWQI
jgi:hypothetical protein